MKMNWGVLAIISIVTLVTAASARAEGFFCPMADSLFDVADKALPSSPENKRMVIIYVAFPDTIPPIGIMNDLRLDTIPLGMTEFISRQSKGKMNLEVSTLLDPTHAEGYWLASHRSSQYAKRDSVLAIPPLYQGAWIGGSDFDHGGELQSEILVKVHDTYIAHGLGNPFEGTAFVVFVYFGKALHSTWRNIGYYGGYGITFVRKDYFSFLATADYGYGRFSNGYLSGISALNSSDDEYRNFEFILGHEFGHTLGLPHSPPDTYQWDSTSKYYYGVYSGLRNQVIDAQGYVPYHVKDLIDLGWLEVEDVVENMTQVAVTDARVSGKAYRMRLDPYDPDEYFLVTYHSGIAEDAEPDSAGVGIYRSSGLQIWHISETAASGTCSPDVWDLESAQGRYSDPGAIGNPEYWQTEDAVSGFDNMDTWYANGSYRGYEEARRYPGSAGDFFGAVSGKGEFSFRTNPSSFGLATCDRTSGQSIANTIMIRVVEEDGVSAVIDMFTNYEINLSGPTGGGLYAAGRPLVVEWPVDDLGAFNPNCKLLYRSGDMEPWIEIARHVPVEDGMYSWTPTGDHVSATAEIKVEFGTTVGVVIPGRHDGTIEIVDAVTSYSDRSKRPDGTSRMPYQGLPYSSVTVDFDGDGPRDMVVSLLNDRANLYAADALTQDGGIPNYFEDTDAFATGSKPDDVLGVAVADINSDGHEELFGASQAAPRLYQLQGSAYVDMASTWGVATSALLSTTGAWADFDCDGDVDLAIGTSDCGSFEPGVYNVGPPVHDVLLRNDINTSGTFTDISLVSGLQPDYYSNSTTVTWGDVNDDGFPDLFVGEFGEPATGPPHGIDCRLFVNQKDGTFVDVADSLIGIHAAVFTIGAVWRDMDNDGALDLELAKKTSRESLRFDTATGLFALDISEDDGNYSGLQVYDHDLDGVEDVLLLPSVATDVPRLLAGSLDGLAPTYTNVTAATGISIPGKIGGAVAADLNGDGDIDLFLGREPEKDAGGAYLEGDQYLFQAKSQAGTVDAPANNWLSIRLQSPSGMNNRMGIGAKVRMYDSGRQRVRMVDGGSGRGSQDDPTMVFGLGAATTVDSVTVDWPNGYHQVVTGANLNISTGPGGNGSNLIVDPSTLSVAKGVSGTYEFVPGSGVVDWVFSWETPLKTNPVMDRVIFDNQNMAPECLQPVDEISPEGADVVHTIELLANGGQRHEMRWLNRPCLAGCVIKFSVKSAINSNEIVSAVTNFSTRFCPSN